MFHKWQSTEDSSTDVCMGCGTASHVTKNGVVVDYSPLPIDCPGSVDIPHHFLMIGPVGESDAYLDCVRCGYVIDSDTLPADVDWECVAV